MAATTTATTTTATTTTATTTSTTATTTTTTGMNVCTTTSSIHSTLEDYETDDHSHPLRHRHMLLAMDKYLKHKRKQRMRQQHWKEGRLLRSCAIRRKEATHDCEVGGDDEEDSCCFNLTTTNNNDNNIDDSSPISTNSGDTTTSAKDNFGDGSSPTDNIDNNFDIVDQQSGADSCCGCCDAAVDVAVIVPKGTLAYARRCAELHRLGMLACDTLRNHIDDTEGWTKVNVKHMKGFRKDLPGRPMIGKGQVDLGNFFSPEQILKYLWQTEIAATYDQTLAAAFGLEAFPNNIEILYQAFKGRYGQSGRDLAFLTAHKWSSPDRVTIGCKSIEGYPQTDKMLKGYVRGFNHIAGYDICRHATGNVIISFIFQTDIRADAVPKWILNRVKLDQLYVVRSIQKHLHIEYAEQIVINELVVQTPTTTTSQDNYDNQKQQQQEEQTEKRQQDVEKKEG
eukprot:GHVS01019749.1.p1 GENE.GHVS01019749.1~~GHVS01019749.1.p1  ORF type:complete len:500 (-),score=106.25 GHVS01019749.1:1131-2489(-)